MTEREPQLFENFLSPLCGLALVPSGKIIIEKPFLSFLEPADKTFLRLRILFFLLRWMGLVQASAQPKKGINRSSFLIMLAEGILSVWRKNDSHALWWLDTKINGFFGKFFSPSTTQLTPHIDFSDLKMNIIHTEAIFCIEEVDIKGYNDIISNEIGTKVE